MVQPTVMVRDDKVLLFTAAGQTVIQTELGYRDAWRLAFELGQVMDEAFANAHSEPQPPSPEIPLPQNPS